MPYIQNIQPANYIVGAIADSNPYSMLTNVNAEASLSIPFGIAMKLDSASGGFKLPAAAGDITNRMFVSMVGMRVSSFAYDSNGNWVATDTDRASPGKSITGLEIGTIAVKVEEAVSVGQPVFIRYAASASVPANNQLGSFRASADTNTAAAHPMWFYASAAPAGGIATVRVS